MNTTTTVTEEPDDIFLRQKHSPWRRKIWIPFFRGKWEVMAADADLCIHVVTRELLARGYLLGKKAMVAAILPAT